MVTVGHLRDTVSHPWVTIGHFMVTIGYLRPFVDHPRVSIGYP